jgi:hypothetical protein
LSARCAHEQGWHKCKKFYDKGFPCPYKKLDEEETKERDWDPENEGIGVDIATWDVIKQLVGAGVPISQPAYPIRSQVPMGIAQGTGSPQTDAVSTIKPSSTLQYGQLSMMAQALERILVQGLTMGSELYSNISNPDDAMATQLRDVAVANPMFNAVNATGALTMDAIMGSRDKNWKGILKGFQQISPTKLGQAQRGIGAMKTMFAQPYWRNMFFSPQIPRGVAPGGDMGGKPSGAPRYGGTKQDVFSMEWWKKTRAEGYSFVGSPHAAWL